MKQWISPMWTSGVASRQAHCDLPEGTYEKLFALDPEAWSVEADLTEEYFAKFGDKVPAELHIFEHGRHGLGLARETPGANL